MFGIHSYWIFVIVFKKRRAQQSLLCQLRTTLLPFLARGWLYMFMELIRCPKLHFCLLICPLRWKWASSLKKMGSRTPGLFSILSEMLWQNSNVSLLFALVCCWSICRETMLSLCVWLFVQMSLRYQLPVTAALLIFVGIAAKGPLLLKC